MRRLGLIGFIALLLLPPSGAGAAGLTAPAITFRAERTGSPCFDGFGCPPAPLGTEPVPRADEPGGCLIGTGVQTPAVETAVDGRCRVQLFVRLSGKAAPGALVTGTLSVLASQTAWWGCPSPCTAAPDPVGAPAGPLGAAARKYSIKAPKTGAWTVSLGPFPYRAAGLGPDCETVRVAGLAKSAKVSKRLTGSANVCDRGFGTRTYTAGSRSNENLITPLCNANIVAASGGTCFRTQPGDSSVTIRITDDKPATNVEAYLVLLDKNDAHVGAKTFCDHTTMAVPKTATRLLVILLAVPEIGVKTCGDPGIEGTINARFS
jgi:hypothetical protein